MYLIMEVLAGGTLLDELMELESYREHEAKLVFRQVNNLLIIVMPIHLAISCIVFTFEVHID